MVYCRASSRSPDISPKQVISPGKVLYPNIHTTAPLFSDLVSPARIPGSPSSRPNSVSRLMLSPRKIRNKVSLSPCPLPPISAHNANDYYPWPGLPSTHFIASLSIPQRSRTRPPSSSISLVPQQSVGPGSASGPEPLPPNPPHISRQAA